MKQACLHLGIEAQITSDSKVIMGADYLILPGVGSFGDAMANMNKLDLINQIIDFVSSGEAIYGSVPWITTFVWRSEEFARCKGLNIIDGYVKKFNSINSNNERVKIPQINWNQIKETNNNSWQDTPLSNCKENDYMYFVHSYFVQPSSDREILSETIYGDQKYCSSIIADNIFACQFHPEKSGIDGLKIYKIFLNS